jgi:gliding motility-associated-like protein
MIAQMRIFRILPIFIVQGLILCTAKAQTDFSANDTAGCADFHVIFTINSPSISPTDNIKWYFGSGDTVRIIGSNTVSKVFTQDGNYSVTVIINNQPATVKAGYISVHTAISAYFRSENYDAGYNYRFIPYTEVTDPLASYIYMWSYKDSLSGTTTSRPAKTVTSTNPENAIDNFTLNKGIYIVKLSILDSYGCTSASALTLVIEDSIKLPNVFVTGTQDYYEIDPKDIGIILHFQVFNRYGLLVFEQEAPHILWDGRTLSGKQLNTGVYYYILNATKGDLSGKYSQKGFIHLFRSDL